MEKENAHASASDESDIWLFPFSKYPLNDHYRELADKANRENKPFTEEPLYDTDDELELACIKPSRLKTKKQVNFYLEEFISRRVKSKLAHRGIVAVSLPHKPPAPGLYCVEYNNRNLSFWYS